MIGVELVYYQTGHYVCNDSKNHFRQEAKGGLGGRDVLDLLETIELSAMFIR